MDTKNRFKKTQAELPVTISDAEEVVRQIGQLQFQINEIESKAKAQILIIQTEAKKALGDLINDQSNAVTALYAFATKNRNVLAPTAKTITCLAGTFGWRTNTPTVVLSLTEAQVIELLKKSRRKKYIRIKESLDKEQLLVDRPRVAGVRYEQKEEFFVKPKHIPKNTKTFTRVVDK